MARNPKGSSPKLTTQLIEDVCLLLRRGSYIESAAAACGISKDTFYRWMKNGKSAQGNNLEKELSYAVLKSLAEAEMRDLEVIDKAALGTPDRLALDENGKILIDTKGNAIVAEYGLSPNWKASAWRLERKFPDRWGRKSKMDVEVGGEEGGMIITFVDPAGEC